MTDERDRGSRADADDGAVASLRAVLRLFLAATILSTLAEGTIFLTLGEPRAGAAALLTLSFAAVLAIVWRSLARIGVATATMLVTGGAMAVGLAAAPLAPFRDNVLILVPLIAVTIALPYVRGRALALLAAVALSASVVAGALIEFLPSADVGPAWLGPVVRLGSLAIGASVLLYLLVAFTARLRATLDEIRSANAALTAARDDLAAENARTAFHADLLDQVGVAVAATDMDGRIVHWNRAAERLYGWSLEEMLGRVARGVIVPLDRQEEALAIRDAVAAGRSWQGEFELQRKDGSGFPALLFVSGVRDGEGRTVGTLGAVIDLAERKRADETLLHAQKMAGLEALAAGIAHDFNNLLTTIMGNAALLRADLPAGSPAAEGAAEIEVASRRAAELTEQMLTFAGKATRARGRLDLARLVQEMDHLLGVATRDRAAPRYRLDEATPPIEGDRDQLRQVVLGLVLNAAEATPATGTITVSTGSMDADRAYLEATVPGTGLAAGRHAYLEVADTGHGMDDETRRRIFDPFFSTRFAGRGLGLSAVLGIVRAHGGTIAVESAPGRGTTFRVLFPVVAEGPGRAVAGGSGDPPGQAPEAV